MCDRCANIDYPIGDSIWLPCGGPPGRYRAKPPQHGYGEEYFESARVQAELRRQNKQLNHTNRRLVAELELLKSRQPESPAFEKVTINE